MFASLTCDSPLASAEKLPRRYPCFAQWSQTARHTNRAVSTLTKARAVTRTRPPGGPPTKAKRTPAKHPTGAPGGRAHRASYWPSGREIFREKPSLRVPSGTPGKTPNGGQRRAIQNKQRTGFRQAAWPSGRHPAPLRTDSGRVPPVGSAPDTSSKGSGIGMPPE